MVYDLIENKSLFERLIDFVSHLEKGDFFLNIMSPNERKMQMYFQMKLTKNEGNAIRVLFFDYNVFEPAVDRYYHVTDNNNVKKLERFLKLKYLQHYGGSQ